jgi:hypothetical protein
LKFNEGKRMVDKPKTDAEGSDAKEPKTGFTSFPGSVTSNIPTPPSQGQEQYTSKKIDYRKYVVRPFVAIRRFCWNGFLLADKHNGGITALATVAIVALTFFYVSYSKKQWQVMSTA